MSAAGTHAFPGFAFGRGERPLALVGGGLILDSGEAENTFAFRCQDRFLVYTGLLGLPSVLLVLDDAHGRHYARLLATLDERLQRLAAAHGVAAPRLPAPIHVRCDLRTLSLSATDSFDRAAHALARDGARIGFVANQMAPTTARMLGELADLLRGRGVAVDFDRAGCERVAALAQAWHNKARFLAFVRDAAIRGGPPLAPSAVLAPDAFLRMRDWAALAARFAAQCDRRAPSSGLFLKSSQDSSGNVSAILSEANFAERAPAFAAEVRRWLLADGFDDPAHVRELRSECALPPSMETVALSDATLVDLRRRQARRRAGLPLIVQPALQPPAGTWGSPASVGASFYIEDDGSHRVVAVAAQLYRDAQRRQFLGLHVDDGLLDDCRAREWVARCGALLDALAARGYRGPVNFDGCMGADGQYWFVGDCNPRLTAVYVPLAVRAWLRAAGIDVRSVSSFGYRGEFEIPEIRACVDTWSRAGLIFSRERPQGFVILPNLARRDGHDALAINLDVAQASARLARMRELAAQAVPAHLGAIHV
ncbi:hypothetical protein [Burkholderia sp. MSMB1589WGS]|uniref:hypothetical protein n=1 Tax=Burkholderia sp. MSMB1589WGS TaxID=1636425 RepID=UPI0007BABF9C|nr:hypothetical protein [Burkholderia sp. MSMB1589WGS]